MARSREQSRPLEGAPEGHSVQRAATAATVGAVGSQAVALAGPDRVLALQRAAGNRATGHLLKGAAGAGPARSGGVVGRVAGGLLQRIAEDHGWLDAVAKACGAGNRTLILKENVGPNQEVLTRIGDYYLEGAFKPHESSGKRMAFLKEGTLDDAVTGANKLGAGLDRDKPERMILNRHSGREAPLWVVKAPKMNVRAFSTTSKATVGVLEIFVGDCIFEFKFTNSEVARALGHYGSEPPATAVPVGDGVAPVASSGGPVTPAAAKDGDK